MQTTSHQPQQITLEAIELVRAGFLEARKTLSSDYEADLTAWQQSEACHKLKTLTRRAVETFIEEEAN